MKKLFYSFFAVAAMLLATTSCSQDELISNETAGNDAVVTFNLEMEGQTASRVIGDGLTVDQLIFAVFDEDGNEIEKLRQENVVVSNLGAVVKTHLVKGQTYQFVFWAQKQGTGHYDTEDMTQIKVNTDKVLNNDESRDAFYAYEGKIKISGPFSKTIVLKRPFAQLNLGTSAQDLSWASNAGVTIDKTSVTVEGAVYTTLNTFDGSVADEKKAELELNVIPDANSELLVIDDSENQFANDEYYYLSTSYLLAPVDKTLSKEIIFTLMDANDSEINKLYVYNAPLQRNWRTNIVGDILTGEGTFNIVIDPIFDADRNYWMDGTHLDIWDGTSTTPELVNGEYVIDQASDLIGLAEMDEASLEGATFVLTKDLSFKNVETGKDTKPDIIQPLFTENKENGARSITFKGNDHVIRDFVVEDNTNFSSLFGILTTATIENLTIVNADVTGRQNEHANAAVLIAKAFGKIILNNVTVKDSKLKAVQKVGGLIGYSGDNTNSEIVNCTVQNLTVESIDMENESGATGGLIGHINEGYIKINNSYVKNSTLNLIQSVNEAKRANSEFIGVINNGTVEITNCGVENNKFTNSIAWTLYNDPFVGGNRGNATLTVNDKTSVATVDELAAALNAGKDVTLGADIVAEKPIFVDGGKSVTLNLNGKTISAGSSFQYTSGTNGDALIRVAGGSTVTITGNGTVDASTYNDGIMAVWVRGDGNVIIENGTFKIGNDVKANDRNDMIYISGNNPESRIVINGGVFEYVGKYDGTTTQQMGWLYTLNANNLSATERPYYPIIVNGGTFYRFIPGTKNPDGWSDEHELGENKNVYKNDETTPTTDTTPADGAWYTVK